MSMRDQPDGSDDQDVTASSAGSEAEAGDGPFLFHLFRGSELLRSGELEAAQRALGQALALKPNDREALELQAASAMRLESYATAIEAFKRILATPQATPDLVETQVNLGVCYLAIADAVSARDTLLSATQQAPQHARAAHYLALALTQLGQADDGQRVLKAAGIEVASRKPDAVSRKLELAKLGLTPSVPDLPFISRSPGPLDNAIRPTSVQSVGALARASLLPSAPAEGPISEVAEGVLSIRVTTGLVVRFDQLAALQPPIGGFQCSTLQRRSRGVDLAEPMGSERAPFVQLTGSGAAIISSPAGKRLQQLRIQGETLFVRETRLIAFEAQLTREHGRLRSFGVPGANSDTSAVVQLQGSGLMVLEVSRAARALAVRAEEPVVARTVQLVAWAGRLLIEPLDPAQAPAGHSGFVRFAGDGTVYVDLGGGS